MSTFLHYVRCKDALLDCSAPGGERCESLTWVDEIDAVHLNLKKLLRLLQIKNVDANSYYMYKLKVNFHISIQYSSSIDFHSILRVHC